VDGIDTHWLWLILAGLLGIAELLAPGVFLIWLAGAAALTGIAAFLLPLPLPFELALFALFALLAVYLGRRAYDRSPVATSDPLLNDRLSRLIGETVVVTRAIVDGRGRVQVGDGAWPAHGPDAPAGARMRIVGAEEGCLLVEPLPARLPHQS
jgi:inner membrane protein